MAVVWADYEAELHDWLLRLTEEFDLTFPLADQAVNLVPCLLPETPPEVSDSVCRRHAFVSGYVKPGAVFIF